MRFIANIRFWRSTAANFFRFRLNGARLRWRGILQGYYIESGVTASFPEGISIGERAVIQRRASFALSKGGQLRIGKRTRIGTDAVFSVGGIVTLEDNVLIAARCYIGDQKHQFDDPSRPIMHQGAGGLSPVTIGTGSWLGINVSVLPGVTLGRNCVVAANSVVTRSFPDFSILAGAPAELIGRSGSGPDPL